MTLIVLIDRCLKVILDSFGYNNMETKDKIHYPGIISQNPIYQHSNSQFVNIYAVIIPLACLTILN